ncbi:MAG: hypothetical protein GQ565_07725 [Candidatus Aegiribacteria sp.]|nr:hypothetical protein [Candidatus Aegiribacteria sp.]
MLCSIILTGMMFISACSSPEGAKEAVSFTERGAVTAYASEVAGFRFEVSPPDTISLKWSGEGSAVVTDIHVSSGQEIQEGDTLFQLLEDIHIIEMERVSMQLDMVSAMLPSDSLLRQKADSLTQLLDSLFYNEKTLYLSPLNGTATEVLIAADQRIRPGNAVADVSIASTELFHVFPPPDCTVNSWPAGGSDIRLVEERTGYAVYSGELQAIEARLSELLAVPREAVYESELESYVVTVDHDTITVSRVGEKENNLVIILSPEPLTLNLLTWTEK